MQVFLGEITWEPDHHKLKYHSIGHKSFTNKTTGLNVVKCISNVGTWDYWIILSRIK